jgi:hypothetical protein
MAIGPWTGGLAAGSAGSLLANGNGVRDSWGQLSGATITLPHYGLGRECEACGDQGKGAGVLLTECPHGLRN